MSFWGWAGLTLVVWFAVAVPVAVFFGKAVARHEARTTVDEQAPLSLFEKPPPDPTEIARLREVDDAARSWLDVPRRERFTEELDHARTRLVRAVRAKEMPSDG